MTRDLFQLAQQLENQITLNDKEVEDQIEKSKKNLKIAFVAYQQMQELSKELDLNETANEIHFFKEIRPIFTSKLFYYQKLNKVFLKRQSSTSKSYMKFLKRELHKIDSFLELNEHLISMYKNQRTELDDYYFTRSKLDTHHLSATALISQRLTNLTNGDVVVAKYLAYIKLHVILHNELHQTKTGVFLEIPTTYNSNFTWTASKSDMIELMYALVSHKAINNGEIEIKQLVQHFESMFNVSLGDPYRLFSGLRQRKKSPTFFLETLTDQLQNYFTLLDKIDDQQN